MLEPSSETVLGKVSNAGISDFKEAIKSAEIAQENYYRGTTAAQRGELLRRWYELIIASKDDRTYPPKASDRLKVFKLKIDTKIPIVGLILSLENGKTIAEAVGEVTYAASFVAWFAEEAPRAYGDTIPSSTMNSTILTYKEPVGVCGIITPWNFPAAMITRKIAPALAAGCAVVIKPPSETPFTCAALTKLAVEAGLPSKVIQVLPTKDRTAATELCTNSSIKKISFTGSTGVGKMLAKLATNTLKKMSLELGGNAAFIVFDDADLDVAVESAMICKFRCTGQTCVW